MPDSAPPLTRPAAQLAPLDALLLRMEQRGEFPALSASVSRIVEITSSDKGSTSELADQILGDIALTNKLLRLINSAQHSQATQGHLGSVTRAVAMLGFNAVRNLALGLVLVEHVPDSRHAARTKDEFLRALLAGSLAGQFSTSRVESEEVFIGAMFQNLGRLLAGYYFPDEAAEVRRLGLLPAGAVSEEAASARVLGASYETLGLGIAKLWGLPDTVQRYLRKPPGAPPIRPQPPAERVRWAVRAANEVADLLMREAPAAQALRRAVEPWSPALSLPPEALERAVAEAMLKLAPMMQSLQLSAPAGTLLAQELDRALKARVP